MRDAEAEEGDEVRSKDEVSGSRNVRIRGTWQSAVGSFLRESKEMEQKKLEMEAEKLLVEKQRLELEVSKEKRIAAEQTARDQQSLATTQALTAMLAVIASLQSKT